MISPSSTTVMVLFGINLFARAAARKPAAEAPMTTIFISFFSELSIFSYHVCDL
jgi:hypothetical protein